jgi:hypothetical protein
MHVHVIIITVQSRAAQNHSPVRSGPRLRTPHSAHPFPSSLALVATHKNTPAHTGAGAGGAALWRRVAGAPGRAAAGLCPLPPPVLAAGVPPLAGAGGGAVPLRDGGGGARRRAVLARPRARPARSGACVCVLRRQAVSWRVGDVSVLNFNFNLNPEIFFFSSRSVAPSCAPCTLRCVCCCMLFKWPKRRDVQDGDVFMLLPSASTSTST